MTSPVPSWGVATGYEDASKAWRHVPESTREAILEALGAHASPAPAPSGLRFLHPGDRLSGHDRELHTEDGRTLLLSGAVPADAPLGYHSLVDSSGEAVPTVVAPRRCFLPPTLRAWGWAAQLYAARSRTSWGIGDLGDLRSIADWSARHGAGLVLLNPLHATAPTLPQERSPYLPSSRRFRNPLYLRIEEVPGAGALGSRLEGMSSAGRDLNRDPLIDRDAIFRLKMEALEAIWKAAPPDDPDHRRYLADEGRDLERFAIYCVLAETHGTRFRSWPAAYRTPDSAEVSAVADAHRDRVRFHQWLQWLIDRQLASAGRSVDLVTDLAIGVDPQGVDVWLAQDCYAQGFTVGAPPDVFNTLGQNWGQPPMDPWRLRSAGYQPFIAMIRAAFRHAGGIRMDHVMGLFRLFWVPEGVSPADGAYVRYPASDLLDLVALESTRARAFVVGEDLGTVEPQVRTAMRERAMLSYRLLFLDSRRPPEFPVEALSSLSTHDLPTLAGLWTGTDLEDQRQLRMAPNEAATAEMRARLADLIEADASTPLDEVCVRFHRRLAETPSMLVTAALDDAVLNPRRPNMPGTVFPHWPNWSIPLPQPLEDVLASALTHRIADTLNSRQPVPPASRRD